MSKLRIGYKPVFVRSFKKLPAALQEYTKERIAMFSADPQHPSLRVHKLKGRFRGTWSFSIDYKHRVIFVYENKHTALLLDIGDHDVYE